nr:PREDICTED: uncharacterized protein LOC109042044 isoform X1 [Bemisia tabaci]XP_018914152.1 PREDICTED: uncharacterized protein LOC109042044 isoform X1 [Bemisia tabaci]
MSENLTVATRSQDLLPEVLDLLNDCSFLNECDTYDEKVIAEYNNFKPEKSIELLLERFSSGGKPQPLTAFIDDMKKLLSWDYKFRVFGPGIIGRPTSLEDKYGVQSSGNTTDVITYSRLRFLFPTYIGLTSDGQYGENKCFPQMFGAPEFGGLIPSKSCIGSVRAEIITVHLCCLKLLEPETPLRLHHLLLKKRIEEGLLSDDKRARFLIAREILDAYGRKTKKFTQVYRTMCELYNEIHAEIQEVEKINGFNFN